MLEVGGIGVAGAELAKAEFCEAIAEARSTACVMSELCCCPHEVLVITSADKISALTRCPDMAHPNDEPTVHRVIETRHSIRALPAGKACGAVTKGSEKERVIVLRDHPPARKLGYLVTRGR